MIMITKCVWLITNSTGIVSGQINSKDQERNVMECKGNQSVLSSCSTADLALAA